MLWDSLLTVRNSIKHVIDKAIDKAKKHWRNLYRRTFLKGFQTKWFDVDRWYLDFSVTDTAANVRAAFGKNGGNMELQVPVSYLFDNKVLSSLLVMMPMQSSQTLLKQWCRRCRRAKERSQSTPLQLIFDDRCFAWIRCRRIQVMGKMILNPGLSCQVKIGNIWNFTAFLKMWRRTKIYTNVDGFNHSWDCSESHKLEGWLLRSSYPFSLSEGIYLCKWCPV